MRVVQTYYQRAFQRTLWDMSADGYDIFPVLPVVPDKLTKSQQQFVDVKSRCFGLARIKTEAYRKVDHEGCVIEFQRFTKFERISVCWIDYPPLSIWLGWFIYAAWGSLEGVTYKIRKWKMVFERRSTCQRPAGDE